MLARLSPWEFINIVRDNPRTTNTDETEDKIAAFKKNHNAAHHTHRSTTRTQPGTKGRQSYVGITPTAARLRAAHLVHTSRNTS